MTWYSQVNFDCKSSKLKLCAKQHPYQITSNEFKTIESCLLDPYYETWPKSAIHSNLLKLGKITISRSTFYKHAQQIMPSKERKKSRKKGYRPLRASYVNKYWHMDISYFNTDNNQRSFIYAIIDNYSRKIIAWKCEQEISKIHIGSVINEALKLTSLTQLNLVTDGGKENVNQYIQNLILQYYEQSGIDIEHKIALKTIRQSNSMIERFFRIMKSNYLYFNVPYSHQELCLALEKIIHEYNFLRPHYALNHLTPAECFDGKQFPDISKRIKRARKQRFKKNKNCNCTLCICDEPD
ncbi:MAG: DDE-type integrase/transposase/recombinase [bacterium]|nr:DDE-type integrase/transposase/recombinase [bacterium]